MRTDYFPAEEAQVVLWYGNFAPKFRTFAAALGLSAEVPSVEADRAMVEYLIVDYKGGFETSRTGVTGFANKMLEGGIAAPTQIAPYPLAPTFAGTIVEPNIVGRTRRLVMRIKAAPGYTEEMGRSLGIVALGEDEVPSAPVLKIESLPDRKLRIKYRKGVASGCEIYVDFGNGYPVEGRVLTEAVQVMTVNGVTVSGPVAAKVKGRYVQKGEEVGDFGPEYSMVLLP